MPIPAGNPIALTVTFLDQNGNPIDPASGITIKVIDNNGNQTDYTFPTQVARLALGVYSVTVEATSPGTWYGQGQGVLANGFTVTTEDVSETVTASRFT